MKTTHQLNTLVYFVAIGFLVAIGWGMYNDQYLHLGYPYDTFLFYPSDRFMDFYNSYGMLKAFTYINQPLNCYFPLTFWVFYPFTLLKSEASFLLFNALFFIYSYFFMFFVVKKELVNQIRFCHLKLAFLVFLSFPFIFCVDRGNIEALLFIFVSLSMVFLYREKYKLAALFLVFPAGVKLYPALLSLLLLKRRQYKTFLLFIFLVVALSVLAVATLHGGVMQNIETIKKLTLANLNQGAAMDGVRFSGSLMSIIKVMYIVTHPGVVSSQLNAYVSKISVYYSVLAIVFIMLTASYLIYNELAFWKQTVLLIVPIIILPQVSYDYKFIYLLIPLAFFLRSSENLSSKLSVFYFICFAILLVPKNYHIFPIDLPGHTGDPADLKVSISLFIDFFVMLVFYFGIIFETSIKHYFTENVKT